MDTLDFQNLLDELRYDLRHRDMCKAGIVLSSLGGLDDGERRRVLFELSRADAHFVIPLLVTILARASKTDAGLPFLRSLLISRAIDDPDAVLDVLRDA